MSARWFPVSGAGIARFRAAGRRSRRGTAYSTRCGTLAPSAGSPRALRRDAVSYGHCRVDASLYLPGPVEMRQSCFHLVTTAVHVLEAYLPVIVGYLYGLHRRFSRTTRLCCASSCGTDRSRPRRRAVEVRVAHWLLHVVLLSSSDCSASAMEAIPIVAPAAAETFGATTSDARPGVNGAGV